MQSPKPVEILSKKSPEKLRLPQPTDLDLETFRSNDVVWLLGLSSSSKMVPFAPKLPPVPLLLLLFSIFLGGGDLDDDGAWW